MELSTMNDSVKLKTWNEKWKRSHNWKLHFLPSSSLLNSSIIQKQTFQHLTTYTILLSLLKINWNTWNATKSQNDCYVWHQAVAIANRKLEIIFSPSSSTLFMDGFLVLFWFWRPDKNISYDFISVLLAHTSNLMKLITMSFSLSSL